MVGWGKAVGQGSAAGTDLSLGRLVDRGWEAVKKATSQGLEEGWVATAL